MVAMSRQLFNDVGGDMTCTHLYHPWEDNCFKAFPRILLDCTKGSVNFYSLVYLAQIALNVKRLKEKKTWTKLMKQFVNSVILGAVVPISFSYINCINRSESKQSKRSAKKSCVSTNLFDSDNESIRNILGMRNIYLTSLFVPFSLNALAIYLEPPGRRTLVINLFVNLLIEYWIRCLSRAGYLVVSKSKQTLLFMIGSAFLFYFMRLEGDRKKRTPLFWLFTAEKVKRKSDDSISHNTVCPHDGSCMKHILKGSGIYFGVGLGISLAKLILPSIRTPIRAISSIRGRHFKMALFFSSYIGIYRAVICYLCRKKGFDSALYALPAGYLAGLSMLFSPSTGMAIASVTAALKLYTTVLYEKKVLPENVPLAEMLYCFCQGILFSARFVDPEGCPPYIVKLMDKASSGHCKALHDRVLEQALKVGYSS